MKQILIFISLLFSTSLLTAQTNVGRDVVQIYSNNNFYSDTSVKLSHTILPNGIPHIDSTYNLLAFKDNGKIITTGYMDILLTTNIHYTSATYPKYNGSWKPFIIRHFPYPNLSGVFVGIGIKKSYSNNNVGYHSQLLELPKYVSDTTFKFRMDMGSGIYNLPNGEVVKYKIEHINNVSIDDDMSDILITQIGEINGNANDELYFTDTLGVKIGNSVFVNMSLTIPVGAVSMNFFNANDRTYNANISSNHNRFMRMRTFKLSDFGLNDSNYPNAQILNHKLSGTTDQCFMLYNSESFIPTSSLPIKVIYFGGYKKDNTNIVEWTTAKIVNGKSIELQKSNNGSNWETIETFEVEQNSDFVKKYSYVDTKPMQGRNMYRLKLNDIDKYTYSNIINIFNTSENSLHIYPNPATNILYISEVSNYTIYDLLGKVVGNGTSDKVDIQHYINGIYFIEINNQKYKFIKN